MAIIDPSAVWDFAKEVIGAARPDRGRTQATVTRIDPDGTTWVTTGDGGEAPATSVAAGVSVGDTVEIGWDGSSMGVRANVSDPPPAGNVVVKQVDAIRTEVVETAALVADKASVGQLEAESARIDSLQAATADIDEIRANSAKVQNLTAEQLEADHAKVGQLDVSQIAADHATIGNLDTTYMHANMSNSDVAWIQSGTIKDGAIVSAMINDVSANKLTAGTINGSVINVTNLNADNITTGTINGQRIGTGSLSLDKLSEDVYTESEVDDIVDGLNDRIDGAIETHTGTAVPTLNNQPASSWNTTALKDEHVGDVYYVVNSQSQQNGYCYRFTKSGSTYSWQLIKDSDVTAALSRLNTAEGKITTFDSDISTLKTDTGELKTKTESLETRMSDAESDILDKVDTTTFNEVSDTVDQHSQTISQHTTAISNKADSSTVTAVTNRVSKNEQDISGINTTIGELQDTVETKADGSTVETVSNRLNTVSNTVDGHTQTLTSVQNTLSTKADSSTVSTLTTKVNNVSDTVDGHTSQLSSITTTQTTMQGTLDKTVKSSIQLWYSKANTTAPSKPTSKVTSDSTSGNAWRTVVPAYNASYPHYFYCWQYEYVDGTYGWSAVVRDIAMGESQSTARTADSNASAAVTTANTASTNASTALSTANTANTNASDAKTTAATASTTASEAKTTAETAASDASTAKTNAASAVTTANSASTTATNAQNTANANIKSSVQLWFTKANSTAPSKPTSVVSTSNANTANAWNLVVPVWNKSYPHYFYCYQQQKGDGNYQWTDVVYDRATSEAQQLANTTSTNLSTLQEDYATYKQTTTENVSSIGTRLTTAEGKISTAETNISQNAQNIELKVSKEEFNNLEIGGRNLLRNTGNPTASDLAFTNATVEDGIITITPATYAGYAKFKVDYLDFGEYGEGEYTFSFDAKAVSGATYTNLKGPVTYAGFNVASRMSNASFSSSYDRYRGWTLSPTLTYDWTRYTKTFTVPDDLTTGQASALASGSNLTVVVAMTGSYAPMMVRNVKLEKGNKPTDWTPAPEDIETRVSSAESAITQNANNIALKVSESDVTGNYIVGKINLNSTTASITAQHINLQGAVTISDLSSDAQSATLNSNINIGGRNLLTDSESMASWYRGPLATLNDGVVELAGTTSNWNAYIGSSKYDIGYYDGTTSYVWSFDYKSTADCLIAPVIASTAATVESSSWTRTKYTNWQANLTVPSTSGKWKRLVFDPRTISIEQLTSGSGSAVSGYLQIYARTNNVTISIRHMKLEKGNKATDWTPAPKDVDSAISDAAKTATSYVTDITGGGVMVHPSDDATTGVQITDDVDIMRSGTSVINIGTNDAVRIGVDDSTHVKMLLESDAMSIDNEVDSEIFSVKTNSTGTTTVTVVAEVVTWAAEADVTTTANTVSDASTAAGNATVTATVANTDYTLDSTHVTATVTAGTGVSVVLTSGGVNYVKSLMSDADVTTGTLSVEYQRTVADSAQLAFNGNQIVTGVGRAMRLHNDQWSSGSQTETFYVAKNESTGVAVMLGVGSGGYNRGVFDATTGTWLIYRNQSAQTVISGPNFAVYANGGIRTRGGGNSDFSGRIVAQQRIESRNSLGNVALEAASSGNKGVLDTTDGVWVICRTSDDNIVINGDNFSVASSGSVSAGTTVTARGTNNVALYSSDTSGDMGLRDMTNSKWIIYRHHDYGIVLGNSVADSLYHRTSTCTVTTANATIYNSINHCWQNGAVCTVYLSVNLKRSLANASTVDVATAPVNYRPPYEVMGSVYVTGQNVNMQAEILGDGTIRVNNRSGTTVTSSANIYMSFTFAL